MPAKKTTTETTGALTIIKTTVVLPPSFRGGDKRVRDITIRLDGREASEGWYIDLYDTGWESLLPVDTNGRIPTLGSRTAAERFARRWIKAAREQGTLQPNLDEPAIAVAAA
jgi:hypothetical protein